FRPKPGKSSKNYTDFVKRYLSQYDSADVYSHIRCRLAHNYSVGESVALTHLRPELHDPLGTKGVKVINFENFFDDFQAGAISYFDNLATDLELREKFKKRFALGFADVGTLIIQPSP